MSFTLDGAWLRKGCGLWRRESTFPLDALRFRRHDAPHTSFAAALRRLIFWPDVTPLLDEKT
jgi:hypothetical protein